MLHAKNTYRPGDLQRLAEIQQIETLNQSVTYTYEDGTNGTLVGRPNGFTFAGASATWTYDNAGRLGGVTDGSDSFHYGYRYTLSGGLHEGTTATGGTESAMPFTLVGPEVTTTLAYETTRNVLAFRQNDITTGTVSKFAYTVNDIGQRDGLTPTGSAFANSTPFIWGYNERGELITVTRNGLNDFERSYSYDAIGNRLTSTDHNAATTSYFGDTTGTEAGGNTLNQYQKIEFPGSATIQPIHDSDGNLTSGPVPGVNGLNPGVPVPANASLTWDAENRLVKAVVNSTSVEYDYDHLSRLICRTIGTTTTRYLYDGWNRIAEYVENGTGHDLERSYLWGMDLSGSMQGAGGVGGLLSMTVHNTTPATFYPTYDGNGNVSEYINESGVKVAHFEYDPFGNLTVDSENNADAFPYRFSTKPQDLTTGLYYYGYRYYDPVTGRWPSRDPIEEEGGINLYGFVRNNGVNRWDYMGLEDSREQFRPGDEEAMNAAVHSGAIEQHKLTEEEFLNIINSQNPKVTVENRTFKPGVPREYGGRVCEICIEKENGELEYTYYLTVTEGSWIADTAGGRVAPDNADKCEEGEKEVAFWHTHPSILSIDDVRRGNQRTQTYYWSGGDSFSGPDRNFVNNNAHRNPNNLPLFVTYRNGNSLRNWSYDTNVYRMGMRGTDGVNVGRTQQQPQTWPVP